MFNDNVWRLEGCVDRHAPIIKLNKKHINKTCKPWISKTHKDRIFRKKKEDPVNDRIKRAYNLFRNQVTREIRKAKKEYYQNYIENNTSNMKNIWNGIRNILSLGNKNHSLITQIDYKGKHVSSNPGMANAFNDFFTNVGPKLDELIPTNNNNRNPNYYLKTQILRSFLHSPTNLSDIINNLKVFKSTCTCSIPTNLLKVARAYITVLFSDICNSSFKEGIFPDKNKIAKVIPSHKTGSTQDVNNYRPISLLSTFSKIMEKLVAIRLNTYLDLHSIIYPE